VVQSSTFSSKKGEAVVFPRKFALQLAGTIRFACKANKAL
jgi:hypothetical protein